MLNVDSAHAITCLCASLPEFFPLENYNELQKNIENYQKTIESSQKTIESYYELSQSLENYHETMKDYHETIENYHEAIEAYLELSKTVHTVAAPMGQVDIEGLVKSLYRNAICIKLSFVLFHFDLFD